MAFDTLPSYQKFVDVGDGRVTKDKLIKRLIEQEDDFSDVQGIPAGDFTSSEGLFEELRARFAAFDFDGTYMHDKVMSIVTAELPSLLTPEEEDAIDKFEDEVHPQEIHEIILDAYVKWLVRGRQ